MDRKIRHSDKPPRQRWLYQLADYSWGKIIILMIAVIVLSLALAFFSIKAVVAHFK